MTIIKNVYKIQLNKIFDALQSAYLIKFILTLAKTLFVTT